ncbi:hypothetical protein [Pseudomonas sp. PDM09]|uniref:hypothetical protein n=1 Tax=Pseudomonas sp. PDM09 TaxID=2769270 RepID=UPI00177ABBD0|nr:hypothetical protein [Pseudomonas sp. PDM09]MBD9565274.1 hypothetical protein [Pseudomonas sp. PDM09]
MYLIDSDAARKLCQYQLIHELIRALDCRLTDLAVLPQLPFQLRLNNPPAALKKLGSEEAVELAKELVRHASLVEVRVEQSNYFLDVERPDIDSGEAVLFAAMYQSPSDCMVSGDKRAFVALSKIDNHAAVAGIWARLICLEEAIMLILEHGNFDDVSAKVRARNDVDKALSLAFGHSRTADHASVKEALNSFVADLQRETDGRWVLLELKNSSRRHTPANASA